MNLLAIGLVAFVLLFVAILVSRDVYVNRKVRKLARHKYRTMEPLMTKLAANKFIGEGEISWMAKDPSLRYAVLALLKEHSREDLFPMEYLTHEMVAESFLVNWLEFPTELGMAPDEIELLTTTFILDEGESLQYYVFKFRTIPPHWAASHDWMLGVSGPKSAESRPDDPPRRVFSRFKSINSISPELEVAWVHRHIGG